MFTRSAIFRGPVFSGMQKRVRLVLIGVLLVLAAISFVAFKNVALVMYNTQEVKQANQVLHEVKNALSVLKDAEIAQESYLLVHDRALLRSYKASLGKLLASFNALQHLFGDDTAQMRQMYTLKGMVLQKYNLMSGNIKYTQRTGHVSVPLLEESMQVSRELDLKANYMMIHQQRVVNRYQRMLQSSSNQALGIILVFSLLGLVLCFIAYHTVLTAYEQKLWIQQGLELKVDELNRSNKDLEQFAYVASHDLQEPLRKIRAFGDLLVSHRRNYTEEQAQSYVSRMQEAAERMQNLIVDILSFSRVTQSDYPFVPCKLNKLIATVLEDIDAQVTRTGARIMVGRLPEIEGMEVQLRQLFQNLISNAIKFAREGVPPEIRIRSRMVEGRDIMPPYPVYINKPFCELTIADNGIGFEEQYLGKIFEIFQRLHGRNSFEGSGIGLAICKKIVDRHHGVITAKSKVGIGSTFIVYLPVQHINIGVSV